MKILAQASQSALAFRSRAKVDRDSAEEPRKGPVLLPDHSAQRVVNQPIRKAQQPQTNSQVFREPQAVRTRFANQSKGAIAYQETQQQAALEGIEILPRVDVFA